MLSKIKLSCVGVTFGFVTFCSHVWADTFELKKVAEGIYVHHGQHQDIDDGYKGDICNLGVIIGNQSIAVIDSGGSKHTGEQLLQAIRNISKLPIKYVINTHVHPDHTYGNAAFQGEPVHFVGHEKLANTMLLRKEQYEKLNANLLGEAGKASTTIPPDTAVHDQLSLDLGDRVLQLKSQTVAHTHTDLTVLDVKTNTLFTGDLVFAQRTPVLEGDIKGLIAALEKINQTQYALIVPGHGLESPDQKTIIGDELRYLNLLLADVRASIKKGISMEQTMDTAAESERQKWLLFGIANRRNVNVIYPQLEWE
ncbi:MULTISPECIES: quinoprotein relay system zinc metallohydrolase 2 [unclassified Methylophilus]|uniref:quinoprotein relay system zinc metallohydrolase 2 n=1 Tax=unclassified Methylophilus TaxID=2630143 RepID=UPI0006F27CEC|nr:MULTISPECIES: quinoprotein relay system zinc metallohydrolase 2 [unclassified Methylophilus]KQT42618.1 MBL fold metallo-hydrolase [Methylophilus sp. Leaf416]KQT56803.1 MBL fold metallo-hydrolase [Methylophilus sp. Leaf459]